MVFKILYETLQACAKNVLDIFILITTEEKKNVFKICFCFVTVCFQLFSLNERKMQRRKVILDLDIKELGWKMFS